jgi:hypothetical protein
MPYGVPNPPVVFQRAFVSFRIHLPGMWGRIRGYKFTGIETPDESPCVRQHQSSTPPSRLASQSPRSNERLLEDPCSVQ